MRFYTVHEDGSQSLSRVVTRHVGKNISTKSIGNSGREDITHDYKFPERSLSERAALLGWWVGLAVTSLLYVLV